MHRRPSAPNSEPRVLIIDAEDATRRAAVRRLGHEGWRVAAFADGLPALVALRSAERDGSPFDAVVIDPLLRDMDAPQALAAIRTCAPKVPVVVTSGVRCERLAQALVQLPTGTFLAKPFTPGALFELLELVIERPAHVGSVAVEPAPQGEPALHAGALLLLDLAPGVAPEPFARLLVELEGVCYCEVVEGHWDLVAHLQATDRKALRARLERPLALMRGVLRHEIIDLRPPVLDAAVWPLLADFVAGRTGQVEGRDAFVLLEIDPDRCAELYLRAHMIETVVHCDAARDRSMLVLLVRGWPDHPGALRVPDSLRMLPGVLRARALPVRRTVAASVSGEGTS